MLIMISSLRCINIFVLFAKITNHLCFYSFSKWCQRHTCIFPNDSTSLLFTWLISLVYRGFEKKNM
uniref:Alternative protein BTLA n=1 Tax=Homo sapiens TaxID=9606 RepID=L8EAT9_HUMAN|nr:alternative protein BTLA [Homo sapiens]